MSVERMCGKVWGSESLKMRVRVVERVLGIVFRDIVHFP